MEAFIPQSFTPGEAYQFDWSHEHVELDGVDQVVKVAHLRLCHSRAFFIVAYLRERHHPEQVERTIGEVWDEERAALQPMPPVIVVEGVVIGEPARQFSRYNTVYNPWHYVSALEHKPGALRNGAPFKDWNLPASMTRLRERLGRHEGMVIGSSSRSSRWQHFMDSMLQAAHAPPRSRKRSSPARIVNLLHRAAQAPRPPMLQVSEALLLKHEPVADCSRYDRLRVPLSDPIHHCPEILCKLN